MFSYQLFVSFIYSGSKISNCPFFFIELSALLCFVFLFQIKSEKNAYTLLKAISQENMNMCTFM